MKFYYNDKLVRTSKTHSYKFAIMSADDKLWSCHSTLEAAQKEFRRPIAEAENRISTCKKAIAEIQKGKTYFLAKDGRHSYRVDLKGKDISGNDKSQVSTWEQYIEKANKDIEKLKTRKIVELEERG